MKKLFYITPQFPPNSAVGARRALNIVRHLDRGEWEIIVFTAPVPPSRHDPELETLIPDDLLLFSDFGQRKKNKPANISSGTKVPSPLQRWLAERGPYYIPFDEHMWNVPQAFRKGRKLVLQHRPDLILVNADPWSGLLLGHKLAQWSGLPWIADLRDPWSLHDYKMSLRPAIIRSVIRYYESLFFHSAARVVLNTEQCCRAYRDRYASTIEGERLTWIRNAFDRDIYHPPSGTSGGQRFSLHYFGSFRIYADPDPLFRLLATYIRSRNLSPGDIELVLYGKQRQRDLDLAGSMGLLDYLRLRPAVSARDTLISLASASVLILVEGPNRKLQLPAKLYDYLASGKPVLALSDNPELNMIIRTTGCGLVADYHDLQDGLQKLDRFYRHDASSRLRFISGEIEKYAVGCQVADFSRLFNQVLKDRS